MPTRVTYRVKRTYDEKYADLWSELWLKPGAPRAVIVASYRALSKQYHPDVSEADGRAQQRLNNAYKKLIALHKEDYGPGN